MYRLVWMLLLAGTATAARADLAAADAAYRGREFERAFELYRELAELGHRRSQENLAVMYVNGEGVRRDNVLGYAWAKIAAEQAPSEGVEGITRQLEPHMNADARRRADELMARFGQAALKARVLPADMPPPEEKGSTCTFKTPANPDAFYPRGAVKEAIDADVTVDFTVQPEGRAYSARIIDASVPYLFDEAARAVVMHSIYRPKVENGVGVPCTMRIKVKFKAGRNSTTSADGLEDRLPGTRKLAEAGDPGSQYLYALVLLNFAELNTTREATLPWFVKAAQGGIVDAQYLVGAFTLAGLGAERDAAKAEFWLEKAATAGHPKAQLMLANHLVTTRTDPGARQDARRWLEAAVQSNYLVAKHPLAALLATAPEATAREPGRALQLIADVMPLLDYDPVSHEVRAAAKAWEGDFEEAVRSQKTALARAWRLGWKTAPLEARLAGYREKKTWTGNLIAW